MYCPQLNPEKNSLGLLFKTIMWRLFCFLSLVATDGKDGNELKLEKVGLTFSSLKLSQQKIPKKRIMGWAFLNHFMSF